MSDALHRAAALMAKAGRIAAFTGAGISAESGIPTYRGEGGLWKDYDPSKYADIAFFRSDPTYYWSFFKDVRYRALVDSKPNPAHLALADLERRGRLGTVITQNIDGLHQAAGNTSVIELHGNTRIIGCLRCDADHGFEEVSEILRTQMPPTCRRCGGLLKPRVVFFGEALPPSAMSDASAAVARCDLLLVVGSTLQVFPAASLPLVAKQVGAAVVIVNVGLTAMDGIADACVDSRAGEALPRLVEAAFG